MGTSQEVVRILGMPPGFVVGRAQPCQGWGREFEPPFPLQIQNPLHESAGGFSFYAVQSATPPLRAHPCARPADSLRSRWNVPDIPVPLQIRKSRFRNEPAFFMGFWEAQLPPKVVSWGASPIELVARISSSHSNGYVIPAQAGIHICIGFGSLDSRLVVVRLSGMTLGLKVITSQNHRHPRAGGDPCFYWILSCGFPTRRCTTLGNDVVATRRIFPKSPSSPRRRGSMFVLD